MLNKLLEYSRSEAYPFHMPGHKRNLPGDIFPFDIDITEIDGFDNLHHPEGCIREIEDRAAKLYHAERAFLLVNGATCGILSAMRAMTRRGDKVMIARNCHTSVYHAVELLGLEPVYYLPEPPSGERKHRCFGSVNPILIEKLIRANTDAKLLVITSPTYEGICSDVPSIAALCRSYGVRLLVDEAHGAHFPFHDAFPRNAVDGGADCAVVSLHKTLPAMTQTALLLTADSGLVQPLQSALAVFQTSSPSYVLMSSIEYALSYAEIHPGAFDKYLSRLSRLEERLSRLKHLSLLFHADKKIASLFACDRSKLVISTCGTNLTGVELANILRKNYSLEIEMAAGDYIIAMTSVCDTDEGFQRLTDALTEIDAQCVPTDKVRDGEWRFSIPPRSLLPCECESAEKRVVPLCEAEGLVSMEDIFAYPPGIPLVVRGEILTGEVLRQAAEMRAKGVNILSSENTYPAGLTVAELSLTKDADYGKI